VNRTRFGAALLALAAVAVVPLSSSAGAVAPATLGVFAAESIASPLGIVTRVPAESPGGLVLSGSSVQLGKSQAQAAGVTLGPLGDAFIITSAPGGAVQSIPAKVTAQDPPSETSPREASFEQGQEAGPAKGVVLRASASDAPRARAEASGTALDAVVVRTGASTSSSESTVLPDGTVTSTARADVQDVQVGPAGVPPLTFGWVISVATVTIPFGGEPQATLSVRATGAQLAGVPVSVGSEGVVVAGTVAVPPSSVAAVNEALKAFAERGLVLSAVPTVREQGEQAASIRGAALHIRYTAPAPSGVPRPSDVGTDEEFLVGSVSASVTARPRTALDLSAALPPLIPDPAAPTGASTDAGTTFDSGTGGTTFETPAVAGGEPASAADVPAPVEATAPAGFSLPSRASTAAVDALLASYRMFLLAAALGVGALLLARRTTTT
jgi:hypothetical protein